LHELIETGDMEVVRKRGETAQLRGWLQALRRKRQAPLAFEGLGQLRWAVHHERWERTPRRRRRLHHPEQRQDGQRAATEEQRRDDEKCQAQGAKR
jgi:hypothetical protein